MSALTDLIRRKQSGEAWETAPGEVAVFTRDIFNPSGRSLGPNESSDLPWDNPTFGGVIDVSDPLHPVVINEGVYAISIVIHTFDPMTVGALALGFLTLDAADAGATVRGQAVSHADNQFPRIPLSLTFYCPAGAELEAGAQNKDSGSITFLMETIVVQQIS